MLIGFSKLILVALFLGALACGVGHTASESAIADPLPAAEPSPQKMEGLQKAVFAGGCFWGVEAVFEHVKGVRDARSGYAGGKAKTASYETVSGGDTGHAESVEVTFDPSEVSYEQLLDIFFTVAHDPTQLNRQGPDEGTQYRSAIFFANDEQRNTAAAYIEKATAEKRFPQPIVTEVSALDKFYPAEAYHQDYLKHHPKEPYIVYNDLPKLAALKEKFPERYK
jgi:peptide-methionine (S)-S-oxide reductase